jgi:hypothetical protein
MFLETARLVIVPNTLAVIETRLERDDFSLEVAGVGSVHFGAEFPGDPLMFYPGMRDHLRGGGTLSPGGIVIERSKLEAIGEIGCKGDPVDGVADIGYGFNPSVWGRGYATEAVAAFSNWLLERSGLEAVTADTAVTNVASGRVLEKCGFVRTGTGFDPDEGDLILWRKAKSNPA